jgi:c-di-GMP-binding flagellar brake protein YcgR
MGKDKEKQRQPQIGDRGILRILEPLSGTDVYYSTRVEDVTMDIIACSQPMFGETYIKVMSDVVDLMYIKGNSVFSLRCEVIDQGKGDPPLLFLRPVSGVQRTDRRRFVRVPMLLPVSVLFLRSFPANVAKFWQEHSVDAVMGTIVDLSAGGCKLSLREPCYVGEKMLIHFVVAEPVNDSFLLRCIARRVEQSKEKGKILVGVEFVLDNERERDKLVKVVFCRQRELIQKGYYELEE